MRSRRIPALLTSTCRSPNVSTASATTSPACDQSAMSWPLTAARPPACSISSDDLPGGRRIRSLAGDVAAEVVDDDGGALRGEEQRVAAAEAAAGAGHDRDAPGEPAHAAPPTGSNTGSGGAPSRSRHATPTRSPIAAARADEVRHQPRPLVELHDGDHVGRLERGIDAAGGPSSSRRPSPSRRPAPTRARPCRTPGRTAAGRTGRRRRRCSAGRSAAGPPRPPRTAPWSDRRRRPGRQSRASTTVAPAEFEMPPMPWTTPTSASGTWRSPASPRSWRTASTSSRMPSAPGWQ